MYYLECRNGLVADLLTNLSVDETSVRGYELADVST
jgi:hypothetical protein